ncbi:hypothetical protein AAY473_006446, partial [Plecturocebus cupreus]
MVLTRVLCGACFRASLSLEFSDVIIAHCSLKVLGSGDPPFSASQEAGTLDLESHYVTQAGLKLLASNNPPTLASQNAGAT